MRRDGDWRWMLCEERWSRPTEMGNFFSLPGTYRVPGFSPQPRCSDETEGTDGAGRNKSGYPPLKIGGDRVIRLT